jgi:leader peptidase (prepilin peptidase)/N-methyltransferase
MTRRRRRKRRNGPAELLVATVLLVAVVYALAWPLVRELWRSSRQTVERPTLLHLAEDVRLRSLEAFTVVWLFAIGASLGSFLNVVIYRWPRGRTLLGNSFCPYCNQPIRLRHNLPVLGWFLLRGRCHDCRLPISVRYPLVEATVGTVFVLLAFVELFSGGRNLPVRPPNYYSGIAWVVFDPQWDLIGIYLMHCSLVAVLLSWALIWFDRQRVPASYALIAYLLVVAVACAVLLIHPVPWYGGAWRSGGRTVLHSGLTAAAGILAGSGLGSLLNARRGALTLGLVGAVLGWQAALSTGLLWPVAQRLQQGLLYLTSAPRRLAASRGLALCWAVVAQITCWRLFSLIPGWPSHAAPLWTVPLAAAAATLLAAALFDASDD